MTRKFDEIVDFSEVEKFIDTPVKRYSSGMYVRLAFAVAAHLDPEILVVDEVLAVGDAEFQKKCLGKMGDVAKEGRTVLFVSHNMGAVKELCSRTILLLDGLLNISGSPQMVVQKYLQGSKLDLNLNLSQVVRRKGFFQVFVTSASMVNPAGDNTTRINFSSNMQVKVVVESRIRACLLSMFILIKNFYGGVHYFSFSN